MKTLPRGKPPGPRPAFPLLQKIKQQKHACIPVVERSSLRDRFLTCLRRSGFGRQGKNACLPKPPARLYRSGGLRRRRGKGKRGEEGRDHGNREYAFGHKSFCSVEQNARDPASLSLRGSRLAPACDSGREPGPRVRLSKPTVSVHLSHFLTQKPFGNMGEGLRFPTHVKQFTCCPRKI